MRIRTILPPARRAWSVLTILRVLLAVIFALVAFIFSEVIPDIPPFSHNILRLLVTIWFGLIGYGLFPDLARIVTVNAMSLINSMTNKVTIEIMNQIVRVQSQSPYTPIRRKDRSEAFQLTNHLF